MGIANGVSCDSLGNPECFLFLVNFSSDMHESLSYSLIRAKERNVVEGALESSLSTRFSLILKTVDIIRPSPNFIANEELS